MPLFNREHYSTAEKIIDLVVKKIIDYTNEQVPTGRDEVKLNWKLSIEKNDKKHLVKVLGDVLKDILPQPTYEKYKKLKESDKHELREMIAEDYFQLYKSVRGEVAIPPMKDSETEWDLWEYDKMNYFGNLNLSSEFLTKDTLKIKLISALTAVRETLMKSEKNLIQLDNNL